jgi:uncharacterized protein YjbI with pentapeptide repeats
MANKEHLARLRQGVEAWNEWRAANRDIRPDLSQANLSGANLSRADLSWADLTRATLAGADLSQADLSEADLSGAYLTGVDLSRANLARADLTAAHLTGAHLTGADLFRAGLSEANLSRANLARANLSRADLSEANLSRADLSEADLTGAHLLRANLSRAHLAQANLLETHFLGANLSEAGLQGAILVETNLEEANLTRCRVYGISVWNINLRGAQQSDLIITRGHESMITVDNVEVAQFIYLLLHNEKIREVIDTITSKAVLILGRFTPDRKAVLDAMREELRHRNYLPIVFDFEKPASRDLTETISTLAHMARFITADLTEAKSIPQELERIIPDLPSVPVQPVLQASADEYSMFEHFTRYPWVLETYRYKSLEEVIAALAEKVIAPAELKAKELVRPMRR